MATSKKRWWAPRWWALGGVAVIAIAAGLAHWLWLPLDEVVELMAHHGEQEQDDTPPPEDPDTTRALVFALDGIGRDALEQMLEASLPDMHLLIGERRGEALYEHAYVEREALSILPSTTMAAWSSVMSGAPVAETGVPGNEWFVRREAHFYAPAPVSVSGHGDTLRMINDGLVGEAIQVPTLFEQIDGRSHVASLAVHRGADLYTTPEPSALGELFEAFAHGVTGENPPSEDAYRYADRATVDTALAAIDEHGVPLLQVVYFPGVDLYTHGVENPLDSQQRYLTEVVAPQIDRVLDRYRAAEALEDTWVLVISDHGHTPVLDDDAHALGVGEDDEPTAVLEDVGFRVRAARLEAVGDDYSAVVAYQGAIAYVYLADRSSCPEDGDPCAWALPPRYEEDVVPVARAFVEAGRGERERGGLGGAIDLVFTREPVTPGEEDTRPYEVFDGERRWPIDEWLEANPRPDLLRLAPRMQELSAGPHGDRVGDVLLLAKAGADRPIEERYYFSSPYRSWHGSPSASDSTISFMVAHVGVGGAQIRRRVRAVTGPHPSQLHFAPLVRELLGQRGESTR